LLCSLCKLGHRPSEKTEHIINRGNAPLMSAAFFGKGVGASGGAVMADTAPKEIMGLAGGLFKRR